MLRQLTCPNISGTQQVVNTFYSMEEYELVKHKIKENEDLKASLQTLKAKYESRHHTKRNKKYNRKKLRKVDTFAPFDHANYTDIEDIRLRKIMIFVKLPNGKSIPLKVDQFERISNIKSRISEEEGIDQVNQKLQYYFKELADDKLLNDYKIQNNSILKLVLKNSLKEHALSIHTDEGMKLMVHSTLDATIHQIKTKLESIFGVNIADKKLILNGRELNDRRDLLFYGYTKDDMLYLEKKKINVIIQSDD